jgi:hypothetical protein
MLSEKSESMSGKIFDFICSYSPLPSLILMYLQVSDSKFVTGMGISSFVIMICFKKTGKSLESEQAVFFSPGETSGK